MLKKFIIFVVFMFAAGAVAAGFFVRHMADYATTPVGDEAGRSVEITVEPGQSFRSVADRLLEEELIEHPLKFRILGAYQKATTKIKAGEYRISDAMTPEQILRQLSEGKVLLHRITVAEGINIYQVAENAAKADLCTAQEFREAAADPELAESLGIAAENVEGYLFPETYFFARPVTAEGMIRAMVGRFRSVFSQKWEKRAEELGFSVHEIVTLASIIEKETAVEGERKIVSSVFHNRLEKGMRLETDPTVIYGIKDFDGNLTRKDLREPTPYNTYTNFGLPPGPIANPGEASLEAALYPADTDFLFFVARPDRTHHFSTNLKEHNRAVRKHQLNR